MAGGWPGALGEVTSGLSSRRFSYNCQNIDGKQYLNKEVSIWHEQNLWF